MKWVFFCRLQLSSATPALGQEALASAWALVPRAVTAINPQRWMSKPKAAVEAASSRMLLPKPQAVAVQPKRPQDEGQMKAGSRAESCKPHPSRHILISSSGSPSQVRKCFLCNHSLGPIPAPDSEWGDALMQGIQPRAILVTSSLGTFLWVTALYAEITHIPRMLLCDQGQAPLSLYLSGSSQSRGSHCPLTGAMPSSLLLCNKWSMPSHSQC